MRDNMKHNISVNTYQDNNLLFNLPTVGLIDEDILTYYTDTEAIKINLQTGSFTKENNDTLLKITKDLCYLNIKALNKSYDINIKYYDFMYKNNCVTLSYKLETQEEILKIIINIGSVINEL